MILVTNMRKKIHMSGAKVVYRVFLMDNNIGINILVTKKYISKIQCEFFFDNSIIGQKPISSNPMLLFASFPCRIPRVPNTLPMFSE